MAKRTIRLKEHEHALIAESHAPEKIREVADDSLPEGPYRFRTDLDGFILTGNDVDADAPELFIFGDSFVESHFAAEHHRFAAQVERHLTTAGTPYRVRNGGYSGMTSLHMLGVLSAKLPPLLKPRSKVLLIVGQSDVNALSSPGLYWEQSRTISPFGTPTTQAYEMAQSWQAAFQQMLTANVTLCKLLGYDLAISAGRFRNGDFASDAVLQRVYRRKRDVYEAAVEKRCFLVDTVRTIARENSLPHFDISTELLQRPDYFYDLLHLNHEGQTAYSSALASWMSNEWLPHPQQSPGG